MPKGMKFPVQVGPNGGATILDGPTVIDQNVALALTPAGSLHPFHQNITPDEDLIYDIRDQKSAGLLVIHARKVFQEMERLGFARLYPGAKGLNLKHSGSGEEGDMIIQVKYVNLETNIGGGVDVPISSGERR